MQDIPETHDGIETMNGAINAPYLLPTPALLVDEARFDANLARMREHIARCGGTVKHRPHLKTVKSVELAMRITQALGTDAITVSTLKEAEEFASAGFTDILYAVGIVPAKLDRVAALRAKGVDLTIVTDNVVAAQAVGEYCAAHGVKMPVLIEVDCDGHRSGVGTGETGTLLAIADALSPYAQVRGVMTHAGGSYSASTPEDLRACADQERVGILQAATVLRDAGYDAPVTSIGSTPTALNAGDLSGVTEMRAGVYVFFDLVMAGIGVCEPDDIALSVLTSVIGHQHDKGWIIVDSGWMAMSRDRGTAGQAVDQGYGLVCDATGTVIGDLLMLSANQEHGIIGIREGSGAALPDLPVGTQLRILPNHACATAAQFGEYQMVSAGGDVQRVPRFSGW